MPGVAGYSNDRFPCCPTCGGDGNDYPCTCPDLTRKADYTEQRNENIHHTFYARNGDGSQGDNDHSYHSKNERCSSCPERNHAHPISGKLIEGYSLPVGAFLDKDDVFDSDNGEWQKCPLPGVRVTKETTTIWIRPVK